MKIIKLLKTCKLLRVNASGTLQLEQTAGTLQKSSQNLQEIQFLSFANEKSFKLLILSRLKAVFFFIKVTKSSHYNWNSLTLLMTRKANDDVFMMPSLSFFYFHFKSKRGSQAFFNSISSSATECWNDEQN